VNGDTQKFQADSHWRDLIQFYEYFHGDNGAGLGANHQTGWTGVIARSMHLFATTTAEQALELGKLAAVVEIKPKPGVENRQRAPKSPALKAALPGTPDPALVERSSTEADNN
jgi:hypothetical protein